MDKEKALSILAKLGIWFLLFSVLYILRSFFLLIFLTFIFAYIQSQAVTRIASLIHNRTIRVVLVGICLLFAVVLVATYLIPQFFSQAQVFVTQFPSYLNKIDHHLSNAAQNYPALKNTILGEGYSPVSESDNLQPAVAAPKSISGRILGEFFGLGNENLGRDNIKHFLDSAKDLGSSILSILGAFLLSLLFSFLIVLDLPRLSAAVRNLSTTRISFIYQEVAGSIFDFCQLLGRALEAQFFIAICNTTLTALGLFALGLGEKIAFLSVIVFFCSFIPVAGVFISSLPICLFALQEQSFMLVGKCIIMITGVHLIEAYILNPKIYGARLHMNPVIVLIILTIGGKLFHAWGLVLGVPICTYVFGHAIRKPSTRPQLDSH